jgi:hypothetical protein
MPKDDRRERELSQCGPVLAFSEAKLLELRQAVWTPPTSAELATAIERKG